MRAVKKAAVKQTAALMVFLMIGMLLFDVIQAVFVEKSSYPQYRAWLAGEEIDVLVLGNSHADNGIRAGTLSQDLSEISGREVRVFNYAVYGMRMEQMYYFVKELFKSHVPKLIILETFAFCPLADGDREILARRAFDVFPLSRNKIEAVNYCVLDGHESYYLPFLKYHSRWEGLTPYDFMVLYDSSLWPYYGSNGTYTGEIMEDPGDEWFQQAIPAPEEVREITPSEQECLEKLLLLLEEHNVQLLFASVPFKGQMGMSSIEQVKINNFLQERYVNESTIQMLDMNRLWEELEFGYADLYNGGHVNGSGADKVTKCLLEYMEDCIPSILKRL